jgi:hypothetical protein
MARIKITASRVIAALEADNKAGFCLACGEEAEGVEPDARGITCEYCGEDRVFGAEEVLIRWAS